MTIACKTRHQTPRPLPFKRPKRTPSTDIPLRDDLGRQTRLQETIHEYHWNDRARIINALSDPQHDVHGALAQRLANCGSGASIFIDPDKTHVRPWISRCGSRLCPFCGNARTANTTAELTDLMLHHNAERLIILTVRSHDLPLRDQLQQLLHCFKTLRARASWKRHVTGGVYILEITRNKTTGLWHPHLHVLVRGTYYPQPELSKQWRAITRDSNIVWTSRVRDVEGAARELAKYIGKVQHVSELQPAHIRDYATATKGLRMLQTFGDLHGAKPHDTDKLEKAPRTDVRVRLSTLLHIARSGHDEAIVLLTWLCQRYSLFGRYVFHECPQLVPTPRRVDRTLEMLAVLRGDPRPPKPAEPNDLTDDQLDAKICAAFTCYKAGLDTGRFADVHYYHRTETEQIDGNIRN